MMNARRRSIGRSDDYISSPRMARRWCVRLSCSAMAMLVKSLLLLAWAAQASGQTETNTAILSDNDIIPEDIPPFTDQLPIVYLLLGPEATPLARAIVLPESACPELSFTSELSHLADTSVEVRNVGSASLPTAFPIKVCEAKLPNDIDLPAETITFGGRPLPAVHRNPERYVLMGDTGLRVKPKNNGFCHSPGSTKLYDIDQCDGLPPTSRSQFNESWVDGDFQALDDWPLESLSSLAAAEAPHAVVYVGDYLYRQGPCPYPNNAGADCTGINAPSFYELEGANLEYDFVPGNWGDNIYGWWADFFWPARDLLAAAPWIGIRGNHENCERAGHGWFLLISPHPLRKNWTIDTEGECDDFSPPWRVPFVNEQFLLMDDSLITPLNKGVDHFNYTEGACPGPAPEGEVLVPETQSRYEDEDQDDAEVTRQIGIYSEYMQTLEDWSQSHDTNFYASHRPLFAVACDGDHMNVLDWTMQQSLGPHTLDRVSAAIAGHMHWFEALSFEEQGLPAQIVVGNAGTDLIKNYVNQETLPTLELRVGVDDAYTAKVEAGITASVYGYSVMTRGANGYNIVAYGYNEASNQLEPFYDFSVPSGPRVPKEPCVPCGKRHRRKTLFASLPCCP